MEVTKFFALFYLLCATTVVLLSRHVLANEDGYRLPTGIVPTKYTIDLTFLGIVFTKVSNTFTGKVRIDFNITENSSNLKFHASDDYIRITKLLLNEKELTAKQYSINGTTDIVTIPLDGHNMVINGTYFVNIEYEGIISNTDNYGVYKSSYPLSDYETSYLVTTQFQPTHARRAFPCFDEPSFKAIFNVSITYPSSELLNLGVLFNTEEANRNEIEEGTTKVTFKTTPLMSTYLVAFTISDFKSTAGENIDDTKYAVWSREDMASSRDYAVEIGPKILKALNGYTGRNYGDEMSKIDQVALPDFAAGAMENWGLVTYRERLLLWDKENTVDTLKQSIATIIAHELAHQWFGNLITCEWWSEAYLNEGFATYFEYFITHEVEPTWNLDKQFVVSVLQPVLDSDSLEFSQAIKSDASTPQEVVNKFGQITYNKGGSILRMLSHIMGEHNFKMAIQEYVKTEKLQLSTTTSSDLWEVFQTKVDSQYSAFPVGVTLADVMRNWIEKPGYPLLTVSLSGTNLTVSQERFLVSGEDKDSKWFVPITYAESESEMKFQVAIPAAWLTPTNPTVSVEMEYNNSWVLLNTFQTGYYRVNYDSNLWHNIASALQKDNFDGIHELNRAQIVDDIFNIAKAGKLTYSEVFDVVEFLKNDLSYTSWVPAFTGFQYILLRSPSGSQLKTKIQEHLLTLMDSLYKTVSINRTSEDQVFTMTQALASSWACFLGEVSCITDARKMFVASEQNGTKVHKNLRSVVYCNGLRYSSNTSDFDYLWKLYGQTEDSNEKLIILRSLGCSVNPEKLKELLAETLKDDSPIRSQDAASVFAAVYSGSDEGLDAALQFLIDNFKAILVKYSSMSAQSTLIKGIAGRLTTTDQVNKLKNLIDSNEEFQSDLKEVSQEALEQAESNLEWSSMHQADLEKYYGIYVEPENQDDGTSTLTINLLALIAVTFIVFFGF